MVWHLPVAIPVPSANTIFRLSAYISLQRGTDFNHSVAHIYLTTRKTMIETPKTGWS